MKGLAIFFVVMGHVLAWTYNDWNSAVKTNFIGTITWNIIYSFHMPLFMFISGYVVFNPSKKYDFTQVSKRILRYIIPFILVGTILYYYRNDPAGICNYWYLRALAEYVAIIYMVEKIFLLIRIKDSIKFIFEALSFVFLFQVIINIIPDNSLVDKVLCKGHLNLNFYFILGWYFRRNNRFQTIILDNKWLLPITLIPIYIYIVSGMYKQTLLTLSGIFATYAIAKLLLETKYSKKIIYWGKHTLEIYILHFFLLFAAPTIGNYFLSITHLPTALVIQSTYGIVVSFINISISIAIAKLFHKNEILSFVFFGNLDILMPKKIKK